MPRSFSSSLSSSNGKVSSSLSSTSNENRQPAANSRGGRFQQGKYPCGVSAMTDESYTICSTDHDQKNSETLAIEPQVSLQKKSDRKLASRRGSKLNFSCLGLYGRDDSTHALQELFEASKTSRQLVLVSGNAGTGKSVLAMQLQKPAQKAAGFFLRGNFDQQQIDEPYAGIAAACHDLCQFIIEHRYPRSTSSDSRSEDWKFSFEDVKTKLVEELGPDLQLLINVVPNLQHIVGGEYVSNETSSTRYAEAKHRFKRTFMGFIRVVCSFGPLVLTLDDLQWADVASLDLMETIISDPDNQALMIVGIYRSDQVNEQHSLHTTIRAIETKGSANGNEKFAMSQIEIDSLEVDHVNEMLVDILSAEAERTRSLAECIHRKTLGNAFFVIQFLHLLPRENLLSYNLDMMEWIWDTELIKVRTSATENLVDLVSDKLRKLPSGINALIPLVASLGAIFRVDIFRMVILHFNDHYLLSEEQKQATFGPEEFLQKCEEEGMITPFDKESYRWEHDKIQEVALSLVDLSTLGSLQFELGELLLDRLSEGELEQNTFLVANLLGAGEDLGQDDSIRTKIAEVHLNAGAKAFKASAFKKAVDYFSKGVNLLPPGHWKTHYTLSLELFSSGSEAEFCVGNFDEMQAYCDEVLAQSDRPLLDKQRAYIVLLNSIRAQGRATDSGLLCLEVLAKLGCKFPKYGRTSRVVLNLLRAKFTLKSTAEKFSKLDFIEDKSKIWAISLLDNLVLSSYQGAPGLLPLAILKGLDWTVQYGLTEYTSVFLVLTGFLLVMTGDFEGGKVYGKQALELLGITEAKRSSQECRTLFLAHQFVLHWQCPAEMCAKGFLRGYKAGFASGDTENAAWCIYCYLELVFHKGRDLNSLSRDCRIYSAQLKEVKQGKIELFIRLVWQLVLNLKGDSARECLLTGDAVDEEKLRDEISEKKDLNLQAQLDRFRMTTAFWFGYYGLFLEIARETEFDKGAFEKNSPGIFGLPVLNFHIALSALAMARQTNGRESKRYAALGIKFSKKIKSCVKKGNPNVVHYEWLLEAEMAVLKGQPHLAKRHYEVAIMVSGQRGFKSDQALAHERLADFCVKTDQVEDATHHVGEAITLYEAWGASAKSKQLKMKFAKNLTPPSEIQVAREL
jgi:predicted ATPase